MRRYRVAVDERRLASRRLALQVGPRQRHGSVAGQLHADRPGIRVDSAELPAVAVLDVQAPVVALEHDEVTRRELASGKRDAFGSEPAAGVEVASGTGVELAGVDPPLGDHHGVLPVLDRRAVVGDDLRVKLLGVRRHDDLTVFGGERHGFAHARLAPEVEHLARWRTRWTASTPSPSRSYLPIATPRAPFATRPPPSPRSPTPTCSTSTTTQTSSTFSPPSFRSSAHD